MQVEPKTSLDESKVDAEKDILIMMYEQEWGQVRHVENQRSLISNLLLMMAAIILGLISLSDIYLPITVFLMLTGVFGASFSLKLHERAAFHIERARKYRDRLEELFPNTNLKLLREAADKKHVTLHPALDKIRIHKLWVWLHLLVSLIGLLLTISIVLR